MKKTGWNNNKDLCLKACDTFAGPLPHMEISKLLKSCYNGLFYISVKTGEKTDQRLHRKHYF